MGGLLVWLLMKIECMRLCLSCVWLCLDRMCFECVCLCMCVFECEVLLLNPIVLFWHSILFIVVECLRLYFCLYYPNFISLSAAFFFLLKTIDWTCFNIGIFIFWYKNTSLDEKFFWTFNHPMMMRRFKQKYLIKTKKIQQE